MESRSFGVSHVGKVRKRNEDTFLSDDDLRLYVVCDGMGGHAAGNVASQAAAAAAVDYIRQRWSAEVELPARPIREIARAAQLCVAAVHHADVQLKAISRRDPAYQGLGTTMTLLMIVADNAIVAHVGDSSLYHCTDGQVRKVTTDHNLAAELVRTGYCSSRDLEKSRARHMLTRSLGQKDELTVDVFSFPLSPEDYCILCTDGLTNALKSSGELRAQVVGPPADIAGRLVRWANDRDGSDNLTALVVQLLESPCKTATPGHSPAAVSPRAGNGLPKATAF